VVNTNITDTEAIDGGAVHMTFDKTAYQMYKSLESRHKFKGFTWSKADRHNYVFSKMIIQNCKAGRHGGAFYFEDMQRVLVKNT
jgi:hypothetical protein